MTREEIIEELIYNNLNSIHDNHNYDDWFKSILTYGFIGYNNHSDGELSREYKERFQE